MLYANNLTLGYSDNTVPIRNFTYKFYRGVYAVTGFSGSGKTTLLKGLAGLLVPLNGNVENTCSRISMVFQESRLIPSYTAIQNISLVCKSKEQILHILERLNLSEYAQKPVSQLSGGQMRRVAIARALLYGGDCIILDEPFEGLDAEMKAQAASMLRNAFPLIIISTHDTEDALLLSDGEVTQVKID